MEFVTRTTRTTITTTTTTTTTTTFPLKDRDARGENKPTSHVLFRCQYWPFGADEMVDTGQPMKYRHWSGYTVALGREEILIVGGKALDPGRTEILGKDGIWTKKADYPEPIRYCDIPYSEFISDKACFYNLGLLR